MSVLPAYMYTTWMPGAFGGYRGHGFPGPKDTDSCEPLCRYWELNPDPLKEQPVLFTKLSLSHHHHSLNLCSENTYFVTFLSSTYLLCVSRNFSRHFKKDNVEFNCFVDCFKEVHKASLYLRCFIVCVYDTIITSDSYL